MIKSLNRRLYAGDSKAGSQNGKFIATSEYAGKDSMTSEEASGTEVISAKHMPESLVAVNELQITEPKCKNQIAHNAKCSKATADSLGRRASDGKPRDSPNSRIKRIISFTDNVDQKAPSGSRSFMIAGLRQRKKEIPREFLLGKRDSSDLKSKHALIRIR